MFDKERENRKGRSPNIRTEEHQVVNILPELQSLRPQLSISLHYMLCSNCVLQLQHQASSDALHDCRSAPLLSDLGLLQISVVRVGHIEDCPTTGTIGRLVSEQRLLDNKNPRCLDSADKLVRGKIEGILVTKTRSVSWHFGVHLDAGIGSGSGIVPECQSSMTVKHRGDCKVIFQHACHVGGCREAANDEGLLDSIDSGQLCF